MSTGRYYECRKCNPDGHWISNLFEALRGVANGIIPSCHQCGKPQRVRLEFAFGLGAGPRKSYVVAAYCPESPTAWHDENRQRVEFYPFLVVTEHVKKASDRAIWLPYWHLHFKGATAHRKYGQWAPHMDVTTFTDFVERAKRDGHI